jgi:hypothetical protein
MDRRGFRGLWTLLLALAGCRQLAVPPPPGPGTISGRAVVAVPGRTEKVAAPGALVRLLPGGLGATADEAGLFVVEAVTRTSGDLLLQVDADRDGVFERQRLVRLDGYHPGAGRQVSLGDVVLEENATLRGRVRRADARTEGGQGGSVAFVPEGPFTATTADDGRFVLENMPPGSTRIAFLRAGYQPQGYDELTLSAGQDLLLNEVVLEPLADGQVAPGSLEGTLAAAPGADLSGARVELVGGDGLVRLAPTQAGGGFALAGVPAGLYSLSAQLAGYRTARVPNILVSAGQTTRLGVLDLVVGEPLVVPDAGNAGGPDAGPSPRLDGGPDARAPTAVAAPRLAAAPGQEGATLDGSGSSDPQGQALVFHWRQTAGAPVTLSVNDTTAASTRFTAPASPGVLRFELTVENAWSLLSAPALVTVTVQAPPLAVISPSALSVRVNGTALLDGSGSADPAGGPLGYAWSVASGGVTLAPVGDGGLSSAVVRLLAPAVTGLAEVQLVVSTAQGLASAPVVRQVVVNDAPVAVHVDAGLAQVVGFGEPVRLSASATSTAPDDTFTFAWAAPPDAGVLVSSSVIGDVATFTSPDRAGDLRFTVTATASPSGVSATTTALVTVIDDQPPTVVASIPPASSGRPPGPRFLLSATFSKPLDVTSVTPANVRLREGDAGVAVDLSYDVQARTVSVMPRRPLTFATDAQLELSGLIDATAQRNVLAPVVLPFKVVNTIVQDFAPTPIASNYSFVRDSTPAPLITGPDRGWVVGGEWPNISNCGSAMFAPSVMGVNATLSGGSTHSRSCGCGPDEQHFQAALGSTVYVACYPEGVAQFDGTTWSGPSPLSPVQMAFSSDGVSLAGPAACNAPTCQDGLWWRRQLPSGGWQVAEQVELAAYANPTLSTVAGGFFGSPAFGGAVRGTHELALGVLATGALRIFEQVAGLGWTNLSEASPVGATLAPRGAYVGTTPVVCHTYQSGTQLLLRCLVRSGAGWTAYEDVGGGAVDRIFDVQARGDAVFVALSALGAVRVRMLDTAAAAPAFVDVPGPQGASSWNLNGSCQARNPALQLTDQGLWLSFAEYCSGQLTVVLEKAE